jgi:hypothetical protein
MVVSKKEAAGKRVKRGGEKKNSGSSLLKNKEGQFFLIAAVVIIVVIVSVVTVTNYTQKKDNVKLYDLGKELGIESQNVLDYGTYSELNDTEMQNLMENFISNYVNYIQEKKNIYFIFGNKDKINVVGYQELNNESVCVKVYENDTCVPYLSIGQTQEFPAINGEISKVVVTIANEDYQFTLKEGENFYFIVWQQEGGDKNVVTGG